MDRRQAEQIVAWANTHDCGVSPTAVLLDEPEGIVIAIRGTEAHHEISVVKRIRQYGPRLISHHTLRTAQLVKGRSHLFEISSSLVINHGDAAQIGAFPLCGLTNVCFITEQSDARNVLARTHCRLR